METVELDIGASTEDLMPQTGRLLGECLKGTDEVISICRRAAELLRRDLRDPMESIHRVGALTAEASIRAKMSTDEKIRFGRRLISITL